MSLLWSELTSAASFLTFSLAAILIVSYLKLLGRFNRGRSILPPGPRGVPLLGNLPYLDPELHSGFAELARTHGPILTLRLGTKLGIVVSSPSLAKEILRDQDVTFANRDVPSVARVVAYQGSDIVWSQYGPELRMLRKVCVREMLGTASLDAVYALRRREMRGTVAHVYSRAGSCVNVGEQMFLTVLNVITSMLWGGTVEGSERTAIGSEFRQVVGEITDLLGKPNVSDFFPVLERFDVQGCQKKIKGMFSKFDRIFERIIDQRLIMNAEGKGGEKGREDFLQYMLKVKDEEGSKTPFTMNHLKAMLMVFIPRTGFRRMSQTDLD